MPIGRYTDGMTAPPDDSVDRPRDADHRAAEKATHTPSWHQQPWVQAIVGGLLVWGAVLAFGATGWTAGLFDVRRGAIVLVCVAAFLVAWLVLMGRGARRRAIEPGTSASRASVVSGALWVAMATCWMMSVHYWTSNRNLAIGLGWLTLGLWGAACVAVAVTLSDPRPRRGKGLGLLGLAIAAAAVAIFWRRW
jgi:hypothetical protein